MNILDVILSLAVAGLVSSGTFTVVRASLQIQSQVAAVHLADNCANNAAAELLSGHAIQATTTCRTAVTVDSDGWVDIVAQVGRANEVLRLPEDALVN